MVAASKLNQTVQAGLQNVEVEGQANPNTDSEWIISIEDKIIQAQNDDVVASYAKLCIYKIPQNLRKDEKAFTPQIVSLGPYHHGKEQLRNMERHKWRAVHQILKRTNQKIVTYLNAVKELEERARACYEGPLCQNSYDFVEMMVIDSCFLLELIRGNVDEFTELGYSTDDPIFAKRPSFHLMKSDMIMLENQIPMFILDRMHAIQDPNHNQTGFVGWMELRFLDSINPADEQPSKSDDIFNPLTDQGGLHCLDVFRQSLLAIRAGPKPTPCFWIKWWSHADPVANNHIHQLIRCATDLKDSGIKFKNGKTDKLWDIKFNNGVLEIPRILIDCNTKWVFLNLLAYEQCHLNCSNDITSYLLFMDNLIDSAADVSYLYSQGIIEHSLGSDTDVSDLFNRLCQDFIFDINDSRYLELSEQVNRYYNRKWNVWRASLQHNYFSNPWSIISFIAAVVLILLTLAQTFYGIYGFYKPHS